MEIALRSEIPTYAGGLGVLAGDTMRSAADLELPMVAVTLASRGGYFRQRLNAAGVQSEEPSPWDPGAWAKAVGAKIAVQIEDRQVWIGAWLHVLDSHLGGRQPVLLLDTDLPENAAEDRGITRYLYGGDEAYRLKQEIVLGIGGVRILHALGFEISLYHMNEGHSALLGLELLERFVRPAEELRTGEQRYDLPRVRALCRFTTHTPVEAGHDRFTYDLLLRTLATPLDLATLRALGGEDRFNLTRLALNLSEFVNGVAKRHAEVSGRMFPGYAVRAITNGVHPHTWAAASFRTLYDRYLPGWCHEPEILARADCCIPDDALWEAHLACKRELIEVVRRLAGVELRPDLPIIALSRRMTEYKRPDLLFNDVQRLTSIAVDHPFQIVMAGKAHPRDEGGKRLIEQLHRHMHELVGRVPVAYLPNYDMDLARAIVAGADIWLNTPLRPLEASGTSGMKAALNGIPSLSILDGWWLEGCIEGVTGWAIGDDGDSTSDARSLYEKLGKVILPLFHAGAQKPASWISLMKGAISKNAAYFNSHRMMRRYATEVYLR